MAAIFFSKFKDGGLLNEADVREHFLHYWNNISFIFFLRSQSIDVLAF